MTECFVSRIVGRLEAESHLVRVGVSGEGAGTGDGAGGSHRGKARVRVRDPGLLLADVEATHVGTIQLALLDEGRYRKLTECLRDAGFTMDTSGAGHTASAGESPDGSTRQKSLVKPLTSYLGLLINLRLLRGPVLSAPQPLHGRMRRRP